MLETKGKSALEILRMFLGEVPKDIEKRTSKLKSISMSM